MSRVPFQAGNRCWCFVIGLLTVFAIIERALAFTNCYSQADCAPYQSCNDDCMDGVGFTVDLVNCPATAGPPPVPAGYPCLLFSGSTSSTPTFQVCIPAPTSTDDCQATPVNPPVTTCTTGSGYFCTCLNITTGNCDNGSKPTACACTGKVTYPGMGFSVNATCT